MINGETVRKKLEANDNRIGRRLASGVTDPELLNEFYLAALARMPTEAEQQGRYGSLGACPRSPPSLGRCRVGDAQQQRVFAEALNAEVA